MAILNIGISYFVFWFINLLIVVAIYKLFSKIKCESFLETFIEIVLGIETYQILC